MEMRLRRSWLLALLVIACCASILAVDVGETRGQSSQRLQRVRLPRRLSSRHNELTSSTESTKGKHMLLGGHLRTEAADSTTTETTSNTNTRQHESTLEDGLLLSSAGAGKDKKASTSSSSSSSSSDDDDKKTLSQQVKEGKYGLIQNELFANRPKRPGILSYSSNAEVPRDSLKNLGGLDEDEIWLAENHVLVLKGGSFPEAEAPSETHSGGEASWAPIDDYSAPRRQVKIPPRPKVPPPFPVQLLEGGPVQLIGTNGTNFAAENGTIDFEALPGGFKGFLPGEGPYFPLPAPANASGEPPEPERRARPGPFYPALPPGAVIVPPPSNQTDYDDDDQSIYYPPPYSFVYPQDNSTDIPPGPLVPGIILPPPPDFFSSLDDLQHRPLAKDKPSKQRPSSSTTPLPVSRPASFLPPRKSSSKIYKTSSASTPSKTASYTPKPFSRTKLKNSGFQRYHTQDKSSAYQPTLPFVEVTTPMPLKTSTIESPERLQSPTQRHGNQMPETSSEKPWKGLVSSKPVPLVTFFASTTPTSVDQPVETTPLAVKSVLTTTEKPSSYPSQASYYFYEEASNEEPPPPPSSSPAPILFFSTSTEPPPYYKLQLPEEDKKPADYYDTEAIPSPRHTSKDYSLKLLDSIVKQPQIYKYLDSGPTGERDAFRDSSPLRSQSPRMLHSEPLYYQPLPTRSSPKLSYFTTAKPPKLSYYDRPKIGESLFSGKSKPIYQYSFEATNYKRNPSHEPETREAPQIQQTEPPQIPSPRRHKEVPLFASEYQDIQGVADDANYDYDTADKRLPYLVGPAKKERAYYPQSSTPVPIRATTLAGHQQYFTKQDEQLLDDVTKEYFTMFGKKLSGRLPSTTPIYGKSSVTERPKPSYSSANSFAPSAPPPPPPPPAAPSAASPFHVNVHYGDDAGAAGPFSLKDDVLVNYRQPLPSREPDAELISTLVTPSPALLRNRYRNPGHSHVRDYSPPYAAARPPISLEGDIAVNYKPQRPPINPDAEFVSTGDKPNSYFAYRLPGDGGHFYFLTPQAISRQEPSSYLYSRPSRASRTLPRRRRARVDGD